MTGLDELEFVSASIDETTEPVPVNEQSPADEEEAEDENEEDPLLRAVYEDDAEEEACEEVDDEAEYEIPAIPPHLRPVHELDDLDAAVDDLVDSLFAVEDKITNARQFIDRLDSRVTWMLDMLEQLDIPQLSEE